MLRPTKIQGGMMSEIGTSGDMFSREIEPLKKSKKTWTAPVLEMIEIKLTAGGNANHLTERTFPESRFS
jgi:hypothetical protein